MSDPQAPALAEPSAAALEVTVNEQQDQAQAQGLQWDEEGKEEQPSPVSAAAAAEPVSLEEVKVELLACVAALANPDSGKSPADVVALLSRLGERSVSPTQLKSTGIGVEVAKLKKHANPEIKVAAADTVNRWKNCVLPSRKRPSSDSHQQPQQPSLQLYPAESFSDPAQPRKRLKQSAAAPPSSAAPAAAVGASLGSSAAAPTSDFVPLSTPALLEQESQEVSASQALRSRLDKIFLEDHVYRLGATGDKTRDKIQELLSEALKTPESPDSHIRVAVRLESAMFLHFGNTGNDYKDKYRTIILNLRDPNNPDINQRLLEGQLTPETAILLHPTQLASAALQEQRDERLKEHKVASRSDLGATQAMTDQFTCGKCKQNRTTYYQQQTRSADEPMTTFVMCCNCGNRWKF